MKTLIENTPVEGLALNAENGLKQSACIFYLFECVMSGHQLQLLLTKTSLLHPCCPKDTGKMATTAGAGSATWDRTKMKCV